MSSLPTVQPQARSTLVSLVEEHLTSLIRESVTVQRHCKRARIHHPADDEQAGVVKRRLHAEDINMALQWRGSEKIYATGTIGTISSEDKRVNLEQYLKSEMDLRPPQEVGLTMHWLAVDGVQPNIPQNPIQQRTPGAGGSVHRVEQDDDQVPEPSSSSSSGGDNGNGVHVTRLLPRLLSEELQLYFTRITTAVEKGGASPRTRRQQDSALTSVAQDGGLQELVPFFVNYVSKSLFQHIGNPEHCRTLVRMARSLFINPHLHLELHLHQLLPALLTCVVAGRLSSKPFENHWVLRSEAALTLVQACNLFGDDYATLKARVLKTLCDAAGPDKARSTMYGGFVAITMFGANAVNAFLLPLAMEYWPRWQSMLEQQPSSQSPQQQQPPSSVGVVGLEHQMELQMCEQAVLDALTVFLAQDTSQTPPAMRMDWEELEEIFGGDRLVMRSNEESEYALCII